MTKKIIIPLAAVAMAVVATIGIIAFKPKDAVADIPEPPKEIPSGTYCNPDNDDLCIVVDGENIRFQSDDLREAFKAYDADISGITPEELEEGADQTMADWGQDNYIYKTKRFPDREDFFMVMFAITEDEEDDSIWTGYGFKYYPEKKTLSGWAGDFTLVE